MPDYGHLETEKLINQAERRLRVVYNEAIQDVSNKLDAYLKDFARKDAQWKKMLADGKISQQDYNDWRVGQIMMGKRWEEMKQTLAEDLHNSNAIARSIVNGYMPDAYALNHNYATFLVEKGSQMDTSYTLYDRQTVERLMRDDPQLLPPPGKNITDRVAAGKDILWQEGQIQSVTLQSILQGESISNMAERIARTMGEYDRRDSVRYARTAMTGAQNAGRHDGYERAKRMGIPMKQTWIATLDNRTRDAHRELDGQTVEVEEPFEVDGYQIRYPGDPDAPGYLIWNCRCTTIAQIKGFERDASNMDLRHDEHLGTMSYEDWKYEHREMPERTVRRPEGEQDILKQFNFVGAKSDAEILSQTNPHYYEARDYQINCQRTVVAEELCYRGYDVTAKPYKSNDPIKSDGTVSWKFTGKWYQDPDVKFIDKRSEFTDTVTKMFGQWGDGSRAIIRVKWKGNNGAHFIFARNNNGEIVYSDPQTGKILNIAEQIPRYTTGRQHMWIMRVDNRLLSENVVYAVENR